MPTEVAQKVEGLVVIGQVLVTARQRSGLSLTQLVRSTRNPRLSGAGDKFVRSEKGAFGDNEELLRAIVQAYHLTSAEQLVVDRQMVICFPKESSTGSRKGAVAHPKPSLGGYRPSA